MCSILFCGEGTGSPFQCSCLANPRVGGAWWAAIYGVAQSRTRLKWLSSSSRYCSACFTFIASFNFHGNLWAKYYYYSTLWMRKLRHREGKQMVKVKHLVSGGPKNPRPELPNHQGRSSSFIHSFTRCSWGIGHGWQTRTAAVYTLNLLSSLTPAYQGLSE